jgi:hypothetical protein
MIWVSIEFLVGNEIVFENGECCIRSWISVVEKQGIICGANFTDGIVH